MLFTIMKYQVVSLTSSLITITLKLKFYSIVMNEQITAQH